MAKKQFSVLPLALTVMGLSSCGVLSSIPTSSNPASSSTAIQTSALPSSSKTTASQSSEILSRPASSSIVSSEEDLYPKLQFFPIDENSYRVAPKNQDISGEVIIPETYRNKPVKKVGSFSYCKNITKVQLPQGITTIDDSQFEQCAALEEISIPSTVTSIGNRAFAFDWNLKSFEIPAAVRSIGQGAFTNCQKMNPCVNHAELTEIPDYAFFACFALREFNMGDKVISIGRQAFGSCESLVSITLSPTMKAFGVTPFQDCYRLTEIVNPAEELSLTMDSPEVPTSVRQIISSPAESALSYQDGFITYQDDNDVYLVAYFGEETNVITPAGVTKIASHAFRNRDNVESLEIGEGVIALESDSLALLRFAKRIILPEGLLSIASRAFFECDALTRLTIPSTVQAVGWQPLDGCIKLYEVINLSSINNGDLLDTSDSDGAEHWQGGITLFCSTPSQSTIETSIDGFVTGVFNGEKALLNYEGNAVSATIPADVKRIRSYCFYKNEALQRIILPASLKYIDRYAFGNCSALASVSLPQTVESIKDGAFSYCTELESLSLPPGITEVANNLVNGCEKLSEFTMGDAVTSIGFMAFANCKFLTSFTFPASIVSISSSVFSGCDSLATFSYEGTKAQWDNVQYMADWYRGAKATTLQCSDGAIPLQA